MGEDLQYCCFKIDGLTYGVAVTRVQEVIRYQEMTTVPLAPSAVRGLINLRGQIVTAIDMRAILGVQPFGGERKPMNVVVQTKDDPISLLVDEIGDVVHVDGGMFEDSPENLDPVARRLIEGVFKMEGWLLLILDIERVLAEVPGVECEDVAVETN